ncbi:MAG: hypothetical protein FWC22_00275 [Treponema sp.]|nr:hypothetical protein [Treponema sp.]
MNINKFVDKKYEKYSFKQLEKAPIDALQGISENSANLIMEAFSKKALSKYVNVANAIVTLAEAEE